MSKVAVFKIFITVITVSLLLFQLVIWHKIARHIRERAYYRYCRAVYVAMVILSQSILWFAVVYPSRGIASAYPDWYTPIHKILLAVNYSHAIWLLPLSAVWVVGMVVRRVMPRAKPAQSDLSPQGEAVSRGDFLRKAAGAASLGVNLLPAATSIAAISGMFLGSREVWVKEQQISLRGLHDDLKGLRIAQLSDIHIGNLIHEKYLNFTLDLVRQAKVDYICITGDIIDSNNAFLPIAGNYLALLRAMVPWGHVFAVMGNHDYIDDGDKAAQSFGDAGVMVLRNETAAIKRGRGQMQVVGLDYPALGIRNRSAVAASNFAKVKSHLRADQTTLVLNHHPSDFEFLQNEKIDLILSGHTHGGQFRFSKDRESILNSGGWLYKYYVDLYERNGVQLYVNRGLGHWFPLRIDCPPEITIFTLA